MGILFSNNHKQIFVLLLMGIAQKQYAQDYPHLCDTYAINVAGKNVVVKNMYYDWSLGELAVHTLTGIPHIIISCGYLQSSYYPLLQYHNTDSFAIKIKIGPNPFSNYVVIQCEQDQLDIHAIQLLDFQGKILFQLNGNYSGHQFYYKMPIQKLINPVCFLNISYSIADHIYKSKFFKLLQN